jgi:4-amino-4-deoxy-L-arabinose transferase-like glycosyltransferase
VTLYFVFQLVYIEADSPTSLAIHAGTYCDEGYKTLDARNLALFGKRHWTEKDEYTGWLRASPITVYFNLLLFKLFGVSLKVARLGNLFFAVGCLLVFYFILKKSYDSKTALLSVFLCALSQVFFFYSRLALFEFKVMFFLLLGLYCMLLSERHYLYAIPALVFWAAAYYCKPTAQVFYISIMLYFIVTYRNGWAVKSILRRRNFVIAAVTILTGFGLLEYLFIYHRELYDNVFLFSRHYRSPVGAVLYYITQIFFTRNGILVFFGVIYIGQMVILFLEEECFNKFDVFFAVWFISGTAAFAFVSFQQLGYYVYVIFPLSVLAVRGILALPSIWKTLMNKQNALLKGTFFVLAGYLLIVHETFLRALPVRDWRGWNLEGIKLLAVFSAITIITLLGLFIFLLRRNREYGKLFKGRHQVLTAVLVVLIVCNQILPIAKWALNPKYELMHISKMIDELDGNGILVGDWAPQICVNTSSKVLYLSSGKRSWNLNNLNEVKPRYLVITSDINEEVLREFNRKYPGVAKFCKYEFQYAGRSVLFYELDFR